MSRNDQVTTHRREIVELRGLMFGLWLQFVVKTV